MWEMGEAVICGAIIRTDNWLGTQLRGIDSIKEGAMPFAGSVYMPSLSPYHYLTHRISLSALSTQRPPNS